MTYADLIAKLEAAPYGNRAYDTDAAMVLGQRCRTKRDGRGRSKGREWLIESHGGLEEWGPHPHPYTTSLDTVLNLVRARGWEWTRHRGANGQMTMVVHTDQPLGRHGQGATDAIALLIAYLSARLDYAALEGER